MKRYAGLVERTIEAGLSPIYGGAAGWQQYLVDYRRMNEIGRWLVWRLPSRRTMGGRRR